MLIGATFALAYLSRCAPQRPRFGTSRSASLALMKTGGVPNHAVRERDLRHAHIVVHVAAGEAVPQPGELAGDGHLLAGAVDGENEIDAVAGGSDVGRFDIGEAQDAQIAPARLVVEDGGVAERSAHHEIVEPLAADRGLVAARQVEDRRLTGARQRPAAGDA